MIETRSKPLVFYAFFTAARQGKTGLTVTVDVYRAATAVVTAAAATEIGGGLYRYTLSSASTATAEAYAAVFKTSDVTVDARHVPSLWVVGPAWAQAAASAVGYGDGDTTVDHNTGGADNLRYVAAGVGVDQAAVRAYLKSDYDAGVYAERGRTVTRPDGRWARPLYLDAGLTYTVTFSKPGVYEVSTKDVTL
jgi:hypothetical protein